MSLKRLYIIVILGCFVQHLSTAEEDPLSGLNWTVIQIVCEANQNLSVCQSINKLKTIEKQYRNSHDILSDWEFALSESYTSEAIPYIKESCTQDPVASHITHACESFRQLKRAKRELERAESDINEAKAEIKQLRTQKEALNKEIIKGNPVRTQDELWELIDKLGIDDAISEANSGKKKHDLRDLRDRVMDEIQDLKDDIEDMEDDWEITLAEDRLDAAEEEWQAVRKVTMEVACDLKEGPETFCNLLNNVKAQKEVVYSIEERALACVREQTSAEVKQYISDLCTTKENRFSYYYAEICSDFPRINKPLLFHETTQCAGI